LAILAAKKLMKMVMETMETLKN